MGLFYDYELIKRISEELEVMANDNPRLCGIMGGAASLYSITPIYDKALSIIAKSEEGKFAIPITDDDINFFIQALGLLSDAQNDFSNHLLRHHFNVNGNDTTKEAQYKTERKSFSDKIRQSLHNTHSIILINILQPYFTNTLNINFLKPPKPIF